MHPVLFHIGPLAIHTYGVLVAFGFMAGLWLAARRAPNEGIKPDQIGDLGVWLIVSGMGGGKLFYVVTYWNEFITSWREMGLRSLREGFVFYGGFIVAVLTAFAYARAKRLSLAKILDVCAPSIALGHAFGRLGCFFNGCCFGKACTLPWAVRFPTPHLMSGTPVHPTQLYEVLGNLAISAGLTAFYRRKRFNGQIFWLYVLSYGVLRFVVEFFRGDYDVHYFGVLTIAHLIALGMIATSLTTLALLHRGRG